MRRLFSALTLLPAALAAQAPVAAPAPAAAGLADQFKAQAPAIQALVKTDPDAALAKAEAIIPAVPPAFNKTDFRTAQDSMGEYNALTDMYRTAASCADAAGQWEKARDYATKAKANAQATYDNAVPPFTAFQDTWKKAQAEAQKHLDEEATLAKVEKPTPEQTVQLNGLKLNESVYQKNVSSGKTMVDAVDARLKVLKDQTADFDPFIANISDRLKTEAGNIDKFKGDKKVFAAAALKGADQYKDKDSEVTYLRRLQVLDPSSKAVAHKLDVLLGKVKQEPLKGVVRHKKGH
ncbi:MAG TPA: hypothetical protein VFF76_09185 [Holophagaceae bacterium]|jgi:hypothetical protein|nr:hypothetical protein [Holophagaceae bacterium]